MPIASPPGDPALIGYPRAQLVVPGTLGTFYCVSRCVRRAFLCGQDAVSGRSFEHRKAWLEQRLFELADLFSLSVLAYAVMSNHLHGVVRVDPGHAAGWSDDEVAVRWVRLFRARVESTVDAAACQRKALALLGDFERLAVRRQCLANLSWFMRCLAVGAQRLVDAQRPSPLARLANREDRCSGRFWEGRFWEGRSKCQALLDDAAVLAWMAYVDLNPVRAGVAGDLPGSDHTSITQRLQTTAADEPQPLTAIAGIPLLGFLLINGADYIRLVDWTGRQLHPSKRGVIAAPTRPA